MSLKIITTLGPGGWETYGRRFADSWKKFWPAEVALEVWTHDIPEPGLSYEGVTFKRLDDTDSFKKLKATLGGDKAKDGPSLQFCFKAVALAQAVTPDLDWIGFIDADVEFMQPVDTTLINELFDPNYHLTYLYRRTIKESEGSWFAFNLREVSGASLLADYWGIYNSLEFLHFRKQHDNAVLDRLVTLHQAHGLKVKNLAQGSLGLDAFHQSILGAYAIHYKGPNKDTIASPALGGPGRYDTLCNLLTDSIRQTGKANIVEVGTWNGTRAIQMAEAAFAAGATTVSYTGYDTFDDGNDRQHEGHTKPHASEWVVRRRLLNYGLMQARHGRTFIHGLVRGNTLETLRATDHHVAEATFAYIDGGHSLDTVRSDYAALKHVPFVVFDDVIQNDEAGAPEGPRKVFLDEAQGQKHLFISQDGYAGLTQTIGLGIVVKPPYKMPQMQTPLVVKPVDSVEKSEQFEHIRENAAALKEWLKPFQAHTRRAVLVSAGPTLKHHTDEIRQKQQAGAIVFAVKHSLPTLKAVGIRPDFTVVLDPRPVDGLSTHGTIRTQLFDCADDKDTFLFATMTHPSVRKFLEAKGSRLIGWHAMTQGVLNADLPELKTGLVVSGGTCAAMRAPLLAFVLGFRRMDFYGYDFFYEEGTKQDQVKQQLMEVMIGPNGKKFLTTGELVAAMQDLGQWTKWLVENRLTIKFFGEGAGPLIWAQTAPDYEPPGEWDF